MKKLILLAVPLFLLAGCVREDALEFHRVENLSVSVGTTTAVNAVLLIGNNSCRNVSINNVSFRIDDAEGNEVGTLSIAENLRIPKKSMTSLKVPLRIRFQNPVLGLRLFRNIEKNASGLFVTGQAKLKMGGLVKNFKVKNMPLPDFLAIFEDSAGGNSIPAVLDTI